MFFDYQCLWCSKMVFVVENLIKVNLDIWFIFKEFFIFFFCWLVFGLVVRVGEQVWFIQGGVKYFDWYNVFYVIGKVEGVLMEYDVYILV